jgi:hypothetical protein
LLALRAHRSSAQDGRRTLCGLLGERSRPLPSSGGGILNDDRDRDDGPNPLGVAALVGAGLVLFYVGAFLGVMTAIDRWYYLSLGVR